MAEETPTGLGVGDRSQGYEVTGAGNITGLNATYAGKDTRDRDAFVTLIQLSEGQDTSPLFDLARTFETIDLNVLVGPRTVVRFGTGSAVVVGKEQGAPLAGETLAVWLQRRAPLPLSQTASLFLPLIEALGALHARGIAHGQISASQVLVDRSNKAQLLGPWLAYGGEPLEQFKRTQAPELVSGEAPSPVSDVYSLCALLRWALTGIPPASADERLTSKAQRDEDPLTSMSEVLPDLDAGVARALETGLRLHPATRPQSMAALGEVLELHVGESAQSVSAPPPLPSSPWSQTAGDVPSDPASSPPPPLPSSPWSQTAGDVPSDPASSPPPIPASRPRTGGVPPIPKASRTSTIGQAPPPIPSSGSSAAKPKRKIGVGTILSFAIALGIAWAVASGGLFGNDEGSSVEVDAQRDSNRPTQTDVDDEPRKGPQTANREDDTRATGVREQLCNSRFTFETAQDAGSNALRAYLQQCDGIDSDYVEAARDALGLD